MPTLTCDSKQASPPANHPASQPASQPHAEETRRPTTVELELSANQVPWLSL